MSFKTFAKFVLLLLAVGCVNRANTISTRTPGLFDKDGQKMQVRGRSVHDDGDTGQEIYLRRKGMVIKESDSGTKAGSLFNSGDERNFLFDTAVPHTVGRFLSVLVVFDRKKDGGEKERGKKVASAAAAESPAEQLADGEAPETEKASAAVDKEADELLNALPDLNPADPADRGIVKALKVKVVHRFENGDAMVMGNRQSKADSELHEIVFDARVPFDRLVSGEPITTDDLFAVNWRETIGTEVIERASSGWQYEYTARLSGFEESKSVLAQSLEDRRKQLEQTRNNLEAKIKSFAAEKRTFAEQREDLVEKEQKNQEELEKLREIAAESEKKEKEAEEAAAKQEAAP
jgi:hypothetical protein